MMLVLSNNRSMIQRIIYCVWLLLVKCEGVYEAACKYKWYNLEPKKAMNLMMIMIRTNKPMYLTAGKLFPMTMSTFCNVRQLTEIVQVTLSFNTFHDSWYESNKTNKIKQKVEYSVPQNNKYL